MTEQEDRDVSDEGKAKEAGAMFYTMPSELVREQIDPLIRDTVFRINESGWVWTAESCQGHPDAEVNFVWSIEPFLRLVCHRDNEGRALALLMRAMVADPSRDDFHGHNVRLHRSEDRGDYAEWVVYVQARTAFERDEGIAALARFAQAVHLPNPEESKP